jgi:bacteriorhodopsin
MCMRTLPCMQALACLRAPCCQHALVYGLSATHPWSSAVIVSVALCGPVRRNAYSRIKRQGDVYMLACAYLTAVWIGYPLV